MYLKKLKIKGFKSFAEPVELEFSQGISAIVGPNGSGKSNITDAIRWVLGEQRTKTLRGKKMEDVIFAGTEKKAPQSYAEVVLTLDNHDETLPDFPAEIFVTRRLFRSGESEYRMNQKSCKLKDIHTLFMDTGLGKNGYSLISQGGIESIINSSPAELRGIVEEAVGIVNYKTRKQEAEKKLEHTQDNMDRVLDIMQELERQLKPLERQAQKAREYLSIHDELKIVDLFRFCQQLDSIKQTMKTNQNQLNDLEVEINTIQQSVIQRDQSFQNTKLKIREIGEKMNDLDASIEALNVQITKAGGDILVTEERLRHSFEEAKRLKNTIDQYDTQIENLINERNQLDIEKQSMKKKLANQQTELEETTNKRNSTQKKLDSIRLKLEQQSQRAEKIGEHRESLAETIQTLQQSISADQTRLSLNKEQYAELDVERDVRSREEHKASEALDKIKQTLTNVVEKINTTKKQEVSINQTIQELTNRQSVLDNNMKVNRSKVDYLKKVQRNYSDYFPGIQLLMKSDAMSNSMHQYVYGPVGELITVPGRYARAIDVALGNKSQNIVVETVAVASHCIDILKKRRAGRATFLPMDNLRYSTMDARDRQRLSQCNGNQGIAAELVTCDSQYKSVVESLLGRIIVADDFESGKIIRRQFKNYTIVTLDGEIFFPGGAIVGGMTKGGKQSPLFKKVEIEKLEDEYKNLESIQIKNTQALTEQHNKLKPIQETIAQLGAEKAQLEQSQWQKNQILETSRKRQSEIQTLKNDLIKAAEQITHSLMSQQDEADEKQAMVDAMDEEILIDDDSDSVEPLQEMITQYSREIAEKRVVLAKVEEQQHSIVQQMSMLSNQINDVHSRKMTTEQNIHYNQKEVKQLQDFLTERQDSVKNDGNKKTELDVTREKYRQQQNQLNEQLDSLDREIRALNHDLIMQKEAKNNIEIANNRQISTKDHLEETMYSRYSVNYIMALDVLKEVDTSQLNLTEENQRELRSRLNALGQVNVAAIEEFTEVNTRYGFLKEQYDDLSEAKEELQDIIQNLYSSMEKQFAERFGQLQGIFSRMFSILFEGGRAHIAYTDPEHVLESGIELIAQPPGKNLRHISLLSGGEKSMTAIALLFSFLELSPSPFCVIDEIDAALDDHNIYRFTKYMESIADKNQFVIITHRKTTLEVCDAIYGVSMSQSGISKLVSIRLTDYCEPAS